MKSFFNCRGETKMKRYDEMTDEEIAALETDEAIKTEMEPDIEDDEFEDEFDEFETEDEESVEEENDVEDHPEEEEVVDAVAEEEVAEENTEEVSEAPRKRGRPRMTDEEKAAAKAAREAAKKESKAEKKEEKAEKKEKKEKKATRASLKTPEGLIAKLESLDEQREAVLGKVHTMIESKVQELITADKRSENRILKELRQLKEIVAE
jgi:hypothetical protein